MNFVTGKLYKKLTENLFRLDQAIDIYKKSHANFYERFLWQPAWQKKKVDFRGETLTNNAWLKICLDGLSDPQQADVHFQYKQKLLLVIPPLRENIKAFQAAPHIKIEIQVLCEEILQQFAQLVPVAPS